MAQYHWVNLILKRTRTQLENQSAKQAKRVPQIEEGLKEVDLETEKGKQICYYLLSNNRRACAKRSDKLL